MFKVKVYVTLRESVIDPQGTAVKQSLHSMSYHNVETVRVGKYIELELQKTEKPIDEAIKEMCERLLVNTVIEDYRYEVEECEAQ